jgi:CDP-diacylglycerol--glycerol-3-phosphate 3-phosphatidyltransferase
VAEPDIPQAAAGWDAYLVAWSRLHGGYDPRRSTPLVRGWLRVAYTLAGLVLRLGAGPNAVTAAGLLVSLAVPVVAAAGGGWPAAAALLVLVAAVADTVDGAVAVRSGRASRLGQVYDALADRIAEAGWCLAFAVLGAAPWLMATTGALVWLHEYLRARATAAGLTEIGAVTVGERPTRILVVVFALLFAGAGALAGPELPVGTVTAAGAIWALLQAVALLHLFAVVHRDLR